MANDSTSHPNDRVGFVGLGNMGRPMVRRLLGAGFGVVGYDVDSRAGAELAETPGFTRASDLADLRARVVVLMLPTSDVVEQVVCGSGLLSGLLSGTVIVDMGSSVPTRTRQLAEVLAGHGIRLVDGPVSGGVRGAVEGTLTIMVGGDDNDVDEVTPVLAAMGRKVTRVGPVGAGHALKALNNLMSAVHLLASSEALETARRFGLDLEAVLAVVNESSGRSGSTENKWPNFILPETFDSGFALSLMVKDMSIALDLAEAVGQPSPLGRAATELWRAAQARLPADADHTEIVRWLRQDLAGEP